MPQTASSAPTATSRLDSFMPAQADGGEQAGFLISLGDIRAMLWRQRKVLALIVGLSVLIGLVATLLMTPIYQADATVKIDNESMKILDGPDLDPVVTIADTSRYLTTQKRIVESRNLAESVADSLKLGRDDSFSLQMGAKAVDETLPEKQRSSARRAQAIELLQGNVDMSVQTDSRVALVSFTSRDPLLAAKIANSYVENYIDQNVRQGYVTNAYARRILTQQVDEARVKLQQMEQSAIEYARKNRLIDTGDAASGADDGKGGGGKDSGGARSITTASLVALNSSYSEARAARIIAEQKWRAAQNGAASEIPEARQNPALLNLTAERGRVAARLAELRQRYLPEQPEVREASAMLSSLDAQIANAGRVLKSSLRQEYEVALNAERQLEQAKEGLSDDTLAEQQRRVQLNLIARDAETQRGQLNDLLIRLNQVNSAADIASNNISALDRALVPSKAVSPNFQKNLLLALAAGLALAMMVGFIRESLDDTLRSPDDVERKLHLPLLGTTPYVSDITSNDLDDRQGELSEAYYSVRATIDYASAGDVKKIFLVTSSQPAEGKSTTSVALARDFARIGRRVLLIDADLRNPSLHRLLGLSKEQGFVDVLMKHKPFAEVVVKHEIEKLHILPLGPIPPNPVQILSSNMIQEFLADVQNDYDVIVLDSAPIMGLADAPMLSRVADHVVLIVEANRAHFGQAKSAVRRLHDAGADILGVVMTKFSFRDAGYSYDYHYSYYSYRNKQAKQVSSS